MPRPRRRTAVTMGETEAAKLPTGPRLVGNVCDVTGLRVGHWSDPQSATGCTVVLCPEGAVAGVDVRGGAPGSRETALLAPGTLVQQVHAVLLTGGSAFGLGAADGVVRWLEERGHGLDVSVARVPIVPAAVVFDLSLGSARAWPGPEQGYAACQAARAGRQPAGSVGVGTGCTVGKRAGLEFAVKGGLGHASRRLPDDLGGAVVAALVAVNAVGDVLDGRGRLLAGCRAPAGQRSRLLPANAEIQNTTIAVVATDAALDKAAANRLALMAHDGLARAIDPIHTLLDGDTIFALSTGRGAPPDIAQFNALGAAAAHCVAGAVRHGVRAARGLHGVPGLRDAGAVGG